MCQCSFISDPHLFKLFVGFLYKVVFDKNSFLMLPEKRILDIGVFHQAETICNISKQENTDVNMWTHHKLMIH